MRSLRYKRSPEDNSMKREGVDFQPTIEQHAMTQEGKRNLVITFADLI